MSLDRILRRKHLTILGLNSGTSADGLDLAAVRVSSAGNQRRIRFLSGGKKRFPVTLSKRIHQLADSSNTSLDELIYVDNLLGRFYARAVETFVSKFPRKIMFDIIASHGQTVRHLPKKIIVQGTKVAGTLQIGSADFIAAATGRIVVSDFRQADVALGNEGAPITTAAMRELFASSVESRLIVNIGGMSNYFYIPYGGRKIEAADCGPGNSLSDILSWKLYGERFDRGGRHARRGKPSKRIVENIMSSGFYFNRFRSTGRESFGVAMAERLRALAGKSNLSKEDIMATASEVTVRSIVRKTAPIIGGDQRLSKLYLTGGGRYNIFFVERLKQYLPGLEILPIDVLGISGDYVEAAAYAVMGEACVRSRALETVARSGSGLIPVLGKITQPPQSGRRT